MEAIAGGAAVSPTSSVRPSTSNSNSQRSKRKRSRDESNTPHSEDDNGGFSKRSGVKRACNECRQQKLKCDVEQDPWKDCSRCTRLRLPCIIQASFRRIGKRTKQAEMEKRIEDLERYLAAAQSQGFTIPASENNEELQSPVNNGSYSDQYMRSDEAVNSLLTLKQGGANYVPAFDKELENVGLTKYAINSLFGEFWSVYHPYLPFLDPSLSADEYYHDSPLLFWAIIAVASRRYVADPGLLTSLAGPLSRLLWHTVGDVPSNHHIVKALCLICTWPLPISTTSTDPTHILCGVMMKTATGIGLHRPSHTQDFSRVSIDLNKEQLHDRVTTWAVCNIVAQSVGTGYGQPASTLYDWTLAVRPGEDGPFTLIPELEARLSIERFCDKVSKEMYSNATDPRGIAGDETRSTLMRVYRREFNELQVAIMSRQDLSGIVHLHLKAAGLHLRLSAFFDSSTTLGYMDDLMGIWKAANSFLDLIFEMKNPLNSGPNHFLKYATGYILQMIIAACFSLLKLLNSFFASIIDFEKGRQQFHRTIQAIRSMSVITNDLPWRLAELMVQMWNSARVEQRSQLQHRQTHGNNNDDERPPAIDDSLQLKVRCRMSMSLVFDTTWRWRDEFQAQGRGSIEATKNPTNPDSTTESSASSTHMDSTLLAPSQASSHLLQNSLLSAANNASRSLTPNQAHGLPSTMMGGPYVPESNYEVFDPLNWMLDGLVDFPYSYVAVQGLEANQMI